MKIDGDLAEILGMHIGDGCISRTKRYAEYYLGGDLIEEREYHDRWVAPLFNKKVSIPVLNKKVNYKEHPKVGIYGFHIFDERIVKFFESLGIKSGTKINVEIPIQILKKMSLSKRFLRGLFDTDGNIYFDKNRSAKKRFNNRPVIKLGSVSSKLIFQVFNLLISMEYHPRIKKPYKGKRDLNEVHTVLLYRIDDVDKFVEEIGFKNPKHYTKWLIYKKFGFCHPKTTVKQRKEMLENPNIFNRTFVS
ncbi:hypothetical protein KW805_03860 [Candidatus Pacearchaeota archaeon]|nr:hypothetical protein [Candidatus Pacearchaeota archaeon]